MNKLYGVKRLGNTAAGILSLPLKAHNFIVKLFYKERRARPVKKILLMKMWGIGNLTILLPILKKIKERYEGALIYFFTLDSNEGLLEGSPHISRIFYFPLSADFFVLARNVVKYISFFRRARFDLMLNFEQCNRFSIIFSYLAGARRRIGFEIAGCGYNHLYTDTIKNDPALHVSRNFCNLAEKAGVYTGRYEYAPPETDPRSIESVNEKLSRSALENKKMAVLHVGSGENFTGKRWSGVNFARLADELTERYGLAIVYTGTEKEKTLIKDTISKMKYKAHDFCGRFTLKELVELLRRCDLFISNDTGPLHIAVSLGINTVGLYGPMNPHQYCSLNKNSVSLYKSIGCNPCLTDANNKTSLCRHSKCLDMITVEEVLDNISKKFFKQEEMPLVAGKWTA